MSAYISGAVWLSGPPEMTRRYVLLAIADNANDSGYCWPSVDTIVNKCLLSKSTVLRCIADLESEGWLAVTKKSVRAKGNSYQINLDKLTFERPKSGVTVRPEKSSQVSLTTESGVTDDIAIRKNRKEPSNTKFCLPDWIPLEAWEGFVEMRTKRRSPLTDRAKQLTVNSLKKLQAEGYEPGEVLDQSTAKGWLGVFAVNGNGHKNGDSVRTVVMPDGRHVQVRSQL